MPSKLTLYFINQNTTEINLERPLPAKGFKFLRKMWRRKRRCELIMDNGDHLLFDMKQVQYLQYELGETGAKVDPAVITPTQGENTRG